MQHNVYTVYLVTRFCPLTFGRCLYIFWRDILFAGNYDAKGFRLHGEY